MSIRLMELYIKELQRSVDTGPREGDSTDLVDSLAPHRS